ncbi:flagella synthesis protein FlgN [Enterobacter sp. BIGb0383]|uniref:flagella synthesis protein FlgN n=1 Tax=unclassified Enterobacter TaxID=2608935 RepID=UPI000F4941E1|nr:MULTISPECIES: flagellar export chaperone FlgN [unclassified Enterobacter]ROP58295.1 flagella synthesis protein FlgN [Enterobacter sp. BIGb0383]ROS06817.1 flagella synthesis protein FlgN [Enterobacter sp. BIGb0359]
MNSLRATLSKMQHLLEELESVLSEELSQLKRPQVNPVSLQMLSDSKSRLLSAINFYDEQRKTEENLAGIIAPYPHHAPLRASWSKIVAIVAVTKKLNLSVYPLIEIHMQKAASLKNMVNKAGSGTSLYNAHGKSQDQDTGKAYNITI